MNIRSLLNHVVVAMLYLLMGMMIMIPFVKDCQAEEFVIGTILQSDHIRNNKERNENQWPSLYFGRNQWAAGFYQNSDDHTSLFVAHERPLHSVGPLHITLTMGLATGYDASPALPWLSINLRLGIFKTHFIPGVVRADGLELHW